MAWTMLPASTSRRPTRPVIGAVMRGVGEVQRALSICAWSLFSVASSCRTVATCVSSCCFGTASCVDERLVALRSTRAFFSVAAPSPPALRLRELHLEGPRIDLGEQVAARGRAGPP